MIGNEFSRSRISSVELKEVPRLLGSNAMMQAMDILRAHALSLPILAKFAFAMVMIAGVPYLSRRVRLPVVVGLLLSGVLVGPYGLDLIGQNRPIADFFAELGKLFLMFFAGLEIDLDRFREARGKTSIFGLWTTCTPLLLGTIVGLLFGYGVITAIVLGSLLASHTLLGSSIVQEHNANSLEPIAVTVGATVISDTLSLLVFAVCLSTYVGGFSLRAMGLQVIEIAVFVPLIVVGVGRVGGRVLKLVQENEEVYFVVMLIIVVAASALADVINLPGIVGAFLAGLAVNAAVKNMPAKEKLEFLGRSLFIPSFFIVTGFLINPLVFLQSIADNFLLVCCVIGALLAGKGIATEVAGRAFGYTRIERLTMWSLTLPQVAATLAATLVAYNTFDPAGHRLLDDKLLNVVLVLMLTTAILGPVLTERFLPRMMREDAVRSFQGNHVWKR
jgi:Kef-type K+ transport system membrane component KefB